MDILATSHSKQIEPYLYRVYEEKLVFASFIASPFNDTHGDPRVCFPANGSSNSGGIYRFDRS